jgi:hypothetical protein
MVLYRLATEDEGGPLVPPRSLSTAGNRDSFASSSGDSFVSLSSDSKYPATNSSARGLVAYGYDPALDAKEPPDDEDLLHDPSGRLDGNGRVLSARAILNVGVLTILILGLLCLFIFYPVLTFLRNNSKNLRIDGNIRINATGQAPVLWVVPPPPLTFSFLWFLSLSSSLRRFQMPELIDTDTPSSAMTRTGFDGEEYDLVFSDEFNVDGRSFYPGYVPPPPIIIKNPFWPTECSDDPFWEAVDLWYWATADEEWYDPAQVTTKNGALQVRALPFPVARLMTDANVVASA